MTKLNEKATNGHTPSSASIANAILSANGAMGPTPSGTTATSATTATTTNNKPALNDFVRTAIREKAERELGSVQQRLEAFGGIERTRDTLHVIATDLTATTAAFSGLPAVDGTNATKLKKLRKLVDDAHALATELSDTLGVDREREALQMQQREIERALESAGINPKEFAPS